MKPRHVLMGAGLLAAAGLALFGDKSPEVDVAEPVERAAPATAPVQRAAASARPAQQQGAGTILRLVPRAELIGETGDGAFEGGNGAFAGRNWNPPPPPPSAAAANAAPPPPSAPTAPPLPFTVLGKGVADGAWEVYLARADRTYVARVGTVIDGMYRVDTIAPPTLTITYLPLKQAQQLNIGVLD